MRCPTVVTQVRPPRVFATCLAPRARARSRRPKLGNVTVCCPMVVGAMGEDLGYVPLPVTRMRVEAQCQISVGFVTFELDCYYPLVGRRRLFWVRFKNSYLSVPANAWASAPAATYPLVGIQAPPGAADWGGSSPVAAGCAMPERKWPCPLSATACVNFCFVVSELDFELTKLLLLQAPHLF